MNILRNFQMYLPSSGGGEIGAITELTIQNINNVFYSIDNLLKNVYKNDIEIKSSEDFYLSNKRLESNKIIDRKHELKYLFQEYGSDKSTSHNYFYIYDIILGVNREKIEQILEIGLGTNNVDIISNMGKNGKPGASLRAFRDFCPNAQIYGADIDKRILFEEDRIKTFFVDQTDSSSFDKLLTQIPNSFDLVIDDGLHSLDANIRSLDFGLKIIKTGGWVVIEDIREEAVIVWKNVARLLSSHYEPHIIQGKSAFAFAVHKCR